ncbi:MAG: hypothetical protein AAGA92_10195 [Planctomycetota bacterium]
MYSQRLHQLARFAALLAVTTLAVPADALGVCACEGCACCDSEAAADGGCCSNSKKPAAATPSCCSKTTSCCESESVCPTSLAPLPCLAAGGCGDDCACAAPDRETTEPPTTVSVRIDRATAATSVTLLRPWLPTTGLESLVCRITQIPDALSRHALLCVWLN